MAHSIELLIDPDSDAAIRRVWDALADAGLPSQARVTTPTNRPHITLTVADRIAPDVDALLSPMHERLPFGCVVGAPLLFAGSRFTLARLLVPSAELLSLHEQVYRSCLPHMAPGPAPHCAPGRWTPHVTLCRRIGPDQLAQAFALLGDVSGDVDAAVVGLRRWDGDARVEHVLIS
jgi:2'-5' RNA ligase